MKKKIICFLGLLLMLGVGMPVTAADVSRVVDMADVLTAEEEGQLVETLDEISEQQKFDLAVVTTNGLEGKTAMEYADDFYDEHGFGIGKSADGALLLIDMETREWWMSTAGFGIKVFTDRRIEDIGEEILPALGAGEFYEGFSEYADLCEHYVDQARNAKFPIGSRLLISIIVGAVAGFIGVTAMKSEMKSVNAAHGAGNYVTDKGLRLRVERDRYLYQHVTRERLPEKDSGGSSTHTSSSGRSHGGGGGSF